MSQPPLVTIITPAYNRADLVAETIESVLNQDYPNLEYIVLDDGSTDETLAVIKQYDGRLRWESHPNMGETRTVNKGFELARGEIIGVVNSDDPLLPGAVAKLVAALIEHPEVVVVYPDWQLIDVNGRCIQIVKCRDFTSYAEMVRGHYCLPGPGAFFKREVVDKVGGRDPAFRYVGDFDFWLRVGLHGDFLRVPEVLATFRTHANSASMSSHSEEMAREHVTVIEKVLTLDKILDQKARTKNVALLNAYNAAACVCGSRNFKSKINYMYKSISCAPFTFLYKYKYRVIMYVLIILGVNYNNIYYRCNKILHDIKSVIKADNNHAAK